MTTQTIDCNLMLNNGLLNTILDSKFKLQELIGEGSHGKVFSCYNLKNPQQKLAVKFVKAKQIFMQEIKALSNL